MKNDDDFLKNPLNKVIKNQLILDSVFAGLKPFVDSLHAQNRGEVKAIQDYYDFIVATLDGFKTVEEGIVFLKNENLKIEKEIVKFKVSEFYFGNVQKKKEKVINPLLKIYEDELILSRQEIKIERQEINIERQEKYKKDKPKKPETLLDIFQSDKNGNKDIPYERVIDFLKKGCKYIDNKFFLIVGEEGELIWNRNITGSIHYLAGLTSVLIKKGWILDIHSAPDYQRIYQSSFNILFDPKPFKSVSSNLLDKEYLEPFLALPQNH